MKRKYNLIYVISIILVGGWVMTFAYDITNPTNKSVDLWNAIGSLMEGLGIIGLIVTILLQRDDIKINTKELRLNREQFMQQNETLTSQRFESTFFNLLNSHANLVNNSSLVNESGVAAGRQVFALFIDGLIKLLDTEKEESQSFYKEQYSEKSHPVLDAYFGSLAAILDYIETSGLIPDNQKERYYYFVLSQLSLNERALLEYHIKLMYVNEVEPGYPTRDADFVERVRELLKNTGDTGLGRHHFNWMYDYKIKFKRKVIYEFDRLPLTR